MSADLVGELRRNASLDCGTGCNYCGPAADEIEALRRKLYIAICGVDDDPAAYLVTLDHENGVALLGNQEKHRG